MGRSRKRIKKYPASLKAVGSVSQSGFQRFAVCPNCGENQSNPGFCINENIDPPTSSCFICGVNYNSHETANILRGYSHSVESRKEKELDKETLSKIRKASKRFKKIESNGTKEKSLKRLALRKIDPPSAQGLPFYDDPVDNSVCNYAFYDEKGNIVAINRVTENGKRYEGSKSYGLGILREGRIFLVSEGLENLLSVNHVMFKKGLEPFGLVATGDAGNLAKISTDHSWLVRKSSKIIVLADYDRSGTGQEAAMKVARAFPGKVEVMLPPSLGEDWNDLLINNQIEKYL